MNVCAIPSCLSEAVSASKAFCADHYARLPADLRRALYNTTLGRNRIRTETVAQGIAALEALV